MRVFGLQVYADGHRSLMGELESVVGEIGQHLRKAQPVALQSVGHVRPHVEEQLKALLRGAENEQVRKIFQHFRKEKRRVFHGHAPGFDFGEVENVVEQAQQIARGLPGAFQIVALAFVHAGLEQQVGHAQNGVHRCADFVAHARQKVAFGAGGGLRRQARGPEFGDVLKPDQLSRIAPVIDGADAGEGFPARAVRSVQPPDGHGNVDRREALLCSGAEIEIALIIRPDARAVFPRGQACQARGRRVEHARLALAGTDQHGRGRGLYHVAQEAALVLQRRLIGADFPQVVHRGEVAPAQG